MAIKPIPKLIPQFDEAGNLTERWVAYYQSVENTINTDKAPANATYIVQTANSGLSNEQILANLSSGFVKVTTTSGVLSSTGSTTITASDLGTDAVTTTKIQNDAVTTAKIINDAVTYAKIQNVSATDKVLGRSSSGAGDVEEIACIAGGRTVLANSVDWTTYTPTVTLNGAGTVPQYTTNNGSYTRIGNVVYVDVYLNGDGGNEGAGAGQIQIALPIQSSASIDADYIVCGQSLNNTASYTMYGQIAASSSVIKLNYAATYAAAIQAFTGADQSSTTRTLRLHFWYRV